MKLLLDANISWRLVKYLQNSGVTCTHVDQTGLPVPATDAQIWQFAKDNNFISVTNDEAYLNLSNLSGYPPKVVLLKTGNQRTEFIKELLIKHLSDNEDLHTSAETALMEIYSTL